MLIRHEPWDILNELSRILENNQKFYPDDSQVESGRWMPLVDIKEEGDHFKLFVDIPGVDPSDIEISMENNMLSIKGTREETRKEDRKSYHRIERTKGMFYRRFTLPETADAENIHAKTKQGVLEIMIGKKNLSQSRKIEVKNED
jgi:HSP20 family protein